ncbi:MAG: AsmA-like C-terminal domain-containing protein [Desulfobacterales bacterium]
MPNRKNIISFLTRSLLVFIFLALVVMVFTPQLINLEMVKKTIRDNISNNVGGRITYRNLKLAYFPRPHVVIYGAEISIPESYRIKIQWMRIYPKILPLFKGRLQFDAIQLDYADYFMKLPRIQDVASEQPEKNRSFEVLVKSLTETVRGLPEFKLPDLNVRVKNGRVNLIDPLGNRFMLRELQAGYVRGRAGFDFSVQCRSNLWEQITINGSLDPVDFKGRGRLQLSHFRPQTLIAYLFPDSALRITETRASVSIDFQSDGTRSLKADVIGNIPVLEFSRGGRKLAVKGLTVKGAVEVDRNSVRADLAELGLATPAVNMTGSFSYDEKLQDFKLALDGSRIEADSVRQAALALAGDAEPVRDLFEVIRGGTVPWMTVRIRGRTIRDFKQLENIVIRGRMTRGKIFIPGAELDLEDVFGDAVISNGVLKGENLQARFGNSYGQDGSIALDLNPNLTSFHLNIGVNADLSQLVPVLNRVVDDRDFLAELERIKEIEGTALGKLTLGDNLKNLSAGVEVAKVHVKVRYNRIPYPIEINGGRFLLEENRIAIENFSAQIGHSSFTQLSGAIDWTQNPAFKTISQSVRFDLAELHAWLLSFKDFKAGLGHIRTLQGILAAEALNLQGPMFDPRGWRFQTRGAIDKLTLTSGRLPAPLRIQGVKFTCHGKQLDFSNIDAFMGSSSVAGVSGSVNWGKNSIFSAASGASVFNLEDINPVLGSYQELSNALKRFRPLKGTLAFDHLACSGPLTRPTPRQVSVSADVKQLTLQSRRFPGALRVHQGQIRWQNNRLDLKNIAAAFGKSTISRLSAGFNPGRNALFELRCGIARLAAGEIHPFMSSFKELQPAVHDFSTSAGFLTLTDFDISGPFHKPAEWRYDSSGKMQNILVLSEAFAEPVTVDSGGFKLSTAISDGIANRSITLKSVKLTWKDRPLTVAGTINLSAAETLLTLSIDAQGTEWNQVAKFLDYVGKREAAAPKSGRPGSLKGTIKFSAQNFYYDSLTVKPLEADISFQPDKTVVKVNDADICGISLRGFVNLSGQTLELYFVPTAAGHSLDATLTCLTGKNNLATGTFDFKGEIMAKTKPDAVSQALAGKLSFTAEKGRIYRFGLLAKLLAILNVTEIYRGNIPDLAGEGFAYHGISAGAKLQGGKIILEDCQIDGASMGIACEGDIDLTQRKMDLIILVAPFKTVDRIVDILPLIGSVLGGKLISIPFRAKGDLDDPEVYPLPPTAVGSGLLGVLERTLKLPLTIIQPVISGLKKGQPRKSPTEDDSPH